MSNSIERVDALTAADIDWSKAPEGATHYTIKESGAIWFKNINGFWTIYDSGVWYAIGLPASDLIPRPESITDVARSIEAARVEEQFKVEPCPYGCVAATIEQAERTYPHYFKDVSAVDAIDLYHVARLYDITDPALFHAFKKIACAGKRGAKDQAQDVQEAIDALKRWQELNV